MGSLSTPHHRTFFVCVFGLWLQDGEVGSESTVFMPSPKEDLSLVRRESEENEILEEKRGQKAVPPRGAFRRLNTLIMSNFGSVIKAAVVPWASLARTFPKMLLQGSAVQWTVWVSQASCFIAEKVPSNSASTSGARAPPTSCLDFLREVAC